MLVLCILFGSFIEDNVCWIVISGAGAVLFAAYLLYDLQKLMGGRYLTVHPDDYIYAAVQARSVCGPISVVPSFSSSMTPIEGRSTVEALCRPVDHFGSLECGSEWHHA